MEQHHDRLSVIHLHEALEEAPITYCVPQQTSDWDLYVKQRLFPCVLAIETHIRDQGADNGLDVLARAMLSMWRRRQLLAFRSLRCVM